MAALLALGFWQLGQGTYLPAKAWLAQELMQRAWLRMTAGADRATPWPWADTWPVARLTVPAHDVELIVLAGGSGRTMAFGPGHLAASALPGSSGNAIIAGHRDTHFAFLRNVEPGDIMHIETPAGERLRYRVMDTKILDSRRGSLTLETEHATLTLLTCYPFDALGTGGPLRYIVTAALSP